MKIQLIQVIEGRLIESVFTEDGIVAAMELRGYSLSGFNKNPHQRAELQGQPKFLGVCGPMWNGDSIRYECPEAYRALSA